MITLQAGGNDASSRQWRIRALALQIVADWTNFPEQQRAKRLLLIRLRRHVVWRLWCWTHQNDRNGVHNEDAFSGRNQGRKQYPLTELRWQPHKALLDRRIYAGRDDPPLNAFTPATVQLGDRPSSKTPSKVRTISDATHGNFHLHLLQQIPTSKVLYISICSRRRVSRRKWMQFPEYMLPFTVQRVQEVSIKSWNYSLSRQSCKLLFTYLIL